MCHLTKFKNYQYENDSHSKIKGHLHIRVGNVGMPFETKNGKIKIFIKIKIPF